MAAALAEAEEPETRVAEAAAGNELQSPSAIAQEVDNDLVFPQS